MPEGRTALAGIEVGFLTALAAFRWAAWVWMATLALLARNDLEVRWISPVLVGAALVVTAGATALLRRRPEVLLTTPAVLVELGVGAALLVGDGAAYGGDPVGASAPPSLGSVWPVSGVLAIGLARGWVGGAVGGAAMALANVVGKVVAGSPSLSDQALGMSSTAVQYVIAGAAIGYAATRVRTAERRVAEIEARDRVARRLHDGVLQTLAVIQHRADDDALVRLAREQERDLRELLFGTGEAVGGGDLGEALRAAAAWFEDAYGGRATVVAVEDDLRRVQGPRCEALAGAVREALANAGKHGRARAVTIYVEPDEEGAGVFCSVKDDGRGFDPSTTADGQGLSRSVRARMEEVGGDAEVSSSPGRGAEVRLWLP